MKNEKTLMALTDEQMKLITFYAKNNMKELKRICDPLIKAKELPEMETDELRSDAQKVLLESARNYLSDKNCSFKTFLIGNIKRSYKDWTRDRTRQKRCNYIDGKIVQNVNLDFETEDGIKLEEKIASGFDIENESSLDFQTDDNVEIFMSSLSNNQRAILNMKMQDIPIEDIKKKLNISDREYINEMNSIKMNENLTLFVKNKKEFIEEDMHMEERVMEISESEGYRMDKYSMFSLLDMKKTGDINCKYILQRKPFQWSNEERNRYICRILSNLPIPEIILCEQNVKGMTISHLIDGLQRLSYAESFKENHFKVGLAGAERHLIQYREYILDENGNRILDEDGIPEFELKVCDVVGKSYKDLPDELKKRFNNFNFNVTKFFNCNDEQIADHIRDYNSHAAMNNEQSGMTSISTETARKIKTITEKCGFLKNCGKYTTANKIKGKIDRMVAEMIMLLFHPNDWKSNVKATYKYLDENATQEEFDVLASELDKLESVIENAGDEINAMFTTTYTPMWVAVFHNFLTSGKDLHNFVDFLNAYNNELKDTDVNGVSMADFKDQQSKKKATITGKVELLIQLMNEYLYIDVAETENNETELKNDSEELSDIDFVESATKLDVDENDIQAYKEYIDDTVRISSPLYHQCYKALLAITAYVYANDTDQEFADWIGNYANNTYEFNQNQLINFNIIKNAFDTYMKEVG